MTSPRIFALDLDGTLLTDQKTYNRPQLERLLKLLDDQGSYLAIATGNQLPKAQQYMAGLEGHPNLYYIAENGAIIHNRGKDLALWGFEEQLVTRVLQALTDFPELGLVISCRNRSYVPATRVETIATMVAQHFATHGTTIPGYDPQDPLTSVRGFYPSVQPLAETDRIEDTVVKFALNSGDPAAVQPLMEELRGALPPGVTATSSGFGAIDLIVEGNHKGHGLAWLAQHLGVDRQDTYAYGDSGNDLEMFDYAGFAACMQDSDPRLLQRADLQIGSNNDGAVLNHLEDLLLGRTTPPEKK